MKRYSRFFLLAGLVLLVFGGVGLLLFGDVSRPLMTVHFGLGVCLVLLGFLVSFQDGSIPLFTRSSRDTFFSRRFVSLFVTLLLAAAGLVWINSAIFDRNYVFDLTPSGQNSLAPQSIALARSLTKEVHISLVVGRDTKADKENLRTLGRFAQASPEYVLLDTIDALLEPHRLKGLGIDREHTVHLRSGNQELRLADCTEIALASALHRLSDSEPQIVYSLTGHGEPALDGKNPGELGELAAAAQKSFLSPRPLLLADLPEVPQNAAALLVVGPTSPLTDNERDRLASYVNRGGTLFFFLDPRTNHGLSSFLEEYGLVLGNDVIVDQVQQLQGEARLGTQPIVRQYGDHEIVRPFDQSTMSRFHLASSVGLLSGAQGSLLLQTAPTSWAETDLALLFDSSAPTALKGSQDLPGPVSLAALREGLGEGGNGRIVLFGDSDWIRNGFVGFFSNRALVLRALEWGTNSIEGVSLQTAASAPTLSPIRRSTYILILSSSFVLPELLLLCGLFVWWRRRTALRTPLSC